MGKAVGVMLKFKRPTEKEEEDVIVILNHDRLPEPRIKLSEGSICLNKMATHRLIIY